MSKKRSQKRKPKLLFFFGRVSGCGGADGAGGVAGAGVRRTVADEPLACPCPFVTGAGLCGREGSCWVRSLAITKEEDVGPRQKYTTFGRERASFDRPAGRR